MRHTVRKRPYHSRLTVEFVRLCVARILSNEAQGNTGRAYDWTRRLTITLNSSRGDVTWGL